ncbi:GNAT family N-acetyltransferase [Schinkia azotoformans]|uniref:GNAT family N-acetyltransferase n=1 Tax=Schinkia azotoformans TaxID=1454 RepID=UPI002DBF1F16|nr:GNAT family N-acetyltransferase [Schinkia azotoformans]MEC1723938.1 GNAT family N-acetyltransferase [Schinkia azotoformans]
MLNLFSQLYKQKIHKQLDEYKNRIINNGFDYKFVKKETKQGEPVLLYFSNNDEYIIIIHLLSIYKGKSTHSQINLIFSGSKLIIGDIQVLDKRIFNRGYGSVLLEIALEHAKERKIKVVEGVLATENETHFKRQKHFYEKFGFRIMGKSKIYLEL